MKSKFIILFYLLVSLSVFSQSQYKTAQGFTYKIGDTIQIGQPILISLSTGHWKTIFSKKGKNLTNNNLINKSVVIKKIEVIDSITRFNFRIFSSDFYVNIDEALAKGEVIVDPKKQKEISLNDDKYDKLKKIKDLYDSGALTKEEFESEKIKILELIE